MLLFSCKETSLYLTLEGYQFPSCRNEPYDADWLNVKIRASHPKGNWSATQPCLLTWEVIELVEWFKSLANDGPLHSRKSFIEPELSFEWLMQPNGLLRVYLDYELRPPWSPYHGPHEEPEFFLQCAISKKGLDLLSSSLAAEAARFPVRVPVSPFRS